MRLGDVLSDLGHPVAYYPSLARVVGVKECVFVCQFLYWFDKTADGWVYKTQEEIAAETGMSRTEQETVRRNLKRTKILQERNNRILHRMFYRVDKDRLEEVWMARGGDAGNLHSGTRETGIAEGGKPTFGNAGNPHSSLDAETTAETTTKKVAKPLPEIPAILRTPEFEAAWSDWLSYRSEIKKKLVASSAAAQLKKLESFGLADAVESIRNSIQNQWQGLFLPKTNGNARTQRPNPRDCESTRTAIADYEAYDKRMAAGGV